MKKRTRVILQFVLFLMILAGAIIIFWKPLMQFFSNTKSIREFVQGFGILAPIIFIIIVILQVLLAPIPGNIAGLAGGYTFGVILGTLYSMIGLIIGSFIAFYLARKLGRPFVEKIIDKNTLNKFDKIIKDKGIPVLFLIYLLPALPDDAVCYIAGLTKVKIKNLMIISAIGRFPGFLVLSIIGAGFASQNTLFSVSLLIIMMIISGIIYLNRKRLENFIIKNLKRLKAP